MGDSKAEFRPLGAGTHHIHQVSLNGTLYDDFWWLMHPSWLSTSPNRSQKFDLRRASSSRDVLLYCGRGDRTGLLMGVIVVSCRRFVVSPPGFA